MRSKNKPIASVSQGVQAALKTADLMTVLRPHMAKVRWVEIVGPQVAGVTQVEKVQNGTELVVRVKNSVWANELSLLKGDMLRRLNLALGGPVLTEIRFKASGLSKDKVSVPASPPPTAPSTEELAQVVLNSQALHRVEDAVRSVQDEALRERVRASLLRAARVEAWKRARQWQPCVHCGTLTAPLSSPILCAFCRIVSP